MATDRKEKPKYERTGRGVRPIEAQQEAPAGYAPNVRTTKYHDLTSLFMWAAVDVTTLLPAGWQSELVDLARHHKTDRQLLPPHPTSRESTEVSAIPVQGVGAEMLREHAPWLVALYEHEFRVLAERWCGEPVRTAAGDRHTVVLNVQSGSHMRYECHVDTNPVQGMLYVTTHAPGSGGELVIANDQSAASVEEVEADCATIYPVSGHLLFFDGRQHPHFIRSLRHDDAIRVAVAMNYYTPSSPESERPADLDDYLRGQPIS